LAEDMKQDLFTQIVVVSWDLANPMFSFHIFCPEHLQFTYCFCALCQDIKLEEWSNWKHLIKQNLGVQILWVFRASLKETCFW
jgi:hypothetical protein